MNKFKERGETYTNYKRFVYDQTIKDNTGINHCIYFHKKDYKRDSCVLYSVMPVTYEKMDGYTITKGMPMDGTIVVIEAMPRYNYKRMIELVEQIDFSLN